MKYKVGDKVEFKKKVNQWTNDEMKSFLGKTVTISKVNEDCYRIAEDKGRWLWAEESIECLVFNRKIVITSDGTETLARLYENGKVVKSATAKCSPEDVFDFNIGAKLAFDRLIGEEKTAEKWRVVHRPARVGDYIRLKKAFFSFNEVGDILKVAKVKNGTASVKECDHPRGTNAKSDYLWHYSCCYEVIEPCTAEKKEEYYNGKVVCVKKGFKSSSPIEVFTVGKIYDVIDGRVIGDDGYKTLRYKTLFDLCKGMGHEFIALVE